MSAIGFGAKHRWHFLNHFPMVRHIVYKDSIHLEYYVAGYRYPPSYMEKRPAHTLTG